jgi:hypothetical protein
LLRAQLVAIGAAGYLSVGSDDRATAAHPGTRGRIKEFLAAHYGPGVNLPADQATGVDGSVRAYAEAALGVSRALTRDQAQALRPSPDMTGAQLADSERHHARPAHAYGARSPDRVAREMHSL